MKITYTSTNIAWHYRYVRELEKIGVLSHFVTGASRFSPRSRLPEIGNRLIRRDFYQNLYLLSLYLKLPPVIPNFLSLRSSEIIDNAALDPATESDLFLFYRTTGFNTMCSIHKKKIQTICVMEEVNTHVDCCHHLLRCEYERLGMGSYPISFPDHSRRLASYDEADYILCPSTFVKQTFLDRGFSDDRILVNNFGFSFPEYSHRKTKDDDTFRLLYVGQLHFRKGLRYAIEAFKRLKHPRKEFLIVGPSTKITGLEGITIPDNIRFAGILKGHHLEQAYASASAFVLPTIEEGLALVQGEAMAAGLPLITTSHSGAEDIMTDGVEGFIVPPCDSNALLDAFQYLADDPDLLRRMGVAAYYKAKGLGGWDVATSNLTNLFRGLLISS